MESIIGFGGVSSEQACNHKIVAARINLKLSANNFLINELVKCGAVKYVCGNFLDTKIEKTKQSAKNQFKGLFFGLKQFSKKIGHYQMNKMQLQIFHLCTATLPLLRL